MFDKKKEKNVSIENVGKRSLFCLCLFCTAFFYKDKNNLFHKYSLNLIY